VASASRIPIRFSDQQQGEMDRKRWDRIVRTVMKSQHTKLGPHVEVRFGDGDDSRITMRKTFDKGTKHASTIKLHRAMWGLREECERNRVLCGRVADDGLTMEMHVDGIDLLLITLICADHLFADVGAEDVAALRKACTGPAARWMLLHDILGAAKYLHTALGVAHCDMRSSNVVLRWCAEEGRLCANLIDFDAARSVERVPAAERLVRPSVWREPLTRVLVVASHVAPELRANACDYPSPLFVLADVWGAGAVMVEMLGKTTSHMWKVIEEAAGEDGDWYRLARRCVDDRLLTRMAFGDLLDFVRTKASDTVSAAAAAAAAAGKGQTARGRTRVKHL